MQSFNCPSLATIKKVNGFIVIFYSKLKKSFAGILLSELSKNKVHH